MIDKEKVPFAFKVVDACAAARTYLEISEEQDITPVIMGNTFNVEMLFGLKCEQAPEEIIEASKSFDIKEFIKNRQEELEYCSVEEFLGEPKGFKKSEKTPEKSKEEIIANTYILNHDPSGEIYIGLIPTENSFEVPAYVSFGNWNDCPSPQDHVGIMRYWNEKYGIEIVSMTFDVMECIVKNPPSTKEEALELAKEQFFYCPDIVTQGAENIVQLAETLLNSRYWFFWWD